MGGIRSFTLSINWMSNLVQLILELHRRIQCVYMGRQVEAGYYTAVIWTVNICQLGNSSLKCLCVLEEMRRMRCSTLAVINIWVQHFRLGVRFYVNWAYFHALPNIYVSLSCRIFDSKGPKISCHTQTQYYNYSYLRRKVETSWYPIQAWSNFS